MAGNSLFQIRGDTAANWTSNNPTLAAREPGYETDTGKSKIGDGSTAWTSLAYFAVTGPSSAVDGHVALFNSTTGKLIKDSGVGNFANGAIITPTATPATNEIGYLGSPINTQNGTYTTVMTDCGKTIYHTSGSAHTWTIDSNANVACPIGTIIAFANENAGGIVTLSITSDTLRWGSSTGSRSLAANGTATALKVASTTWRLTGDGIT